MNPTEKLIQLVQPHPCLYNINHRDYKNGLKKNIIWDNIAKDLRLSRDVTKTKWKNLKDSYTKYKKQIKGTTGPERKYNWVWASHLQFLDSAIQPRPTPSNDITDEIFNLNETIQSPSRSPASTSSQVIADLMDDLSQSPSSISRDIPFPSPETSSTPEAPSTSMPFKKSKSESQDEMDKVLNYLKAKNKHDGVDYLFASYAETFKKLKPRTQAEVKLKLAQVFTEAELKDLDSENQNSSVPILSSSYSLISTTCDNNGQRTVSSLPLQIIPEGGSIPVVIHANIVDDLTSSGDSEKLSQEDCSNCGTIT